MGTVHHIDFVLPVAGLDPLTNHVYSWKHVLLDAAPYAMVLVTGDWLQLQWTACFSLGLISCCHQWHVMLCHLMHE